MPPNTPGSHLHPRAQRRILLVEDDPNVRDFVRIVLEQRGFQVVLATNADDALALYRSDAAQIQLVLSDVLMPGRTGAELAIALRAINPSVAVVLMSGFTGDNSNTDALPADIEVVQKPFKLDRLLAAVHAAFPK